MNLLETMAEMENGEPFYMVGKRPLDFASGGSLEKASPVARHEHFVHVNGVDNAGFGPNGIFREDPSKLGKYRLTSEYGLKRYEAGLLEHIIKQWDAKNEAIDHVVEELGLQEDVPPTFYKEYSLGANNCQDFVRDVDYRYNLAKRGL
jgi:hypothetical protein